MPNLYKNTHDETYHTADGGDPLRRKHPGTGPLQYQGAARDRDSLASGRSGTHPPHRGRSLRQAPRRRRPQPRRRRSLYRLHPRSVRGHGRCGGRRAGDRHSLRLDRRRGVPPPRKRRHGLYAHGQRHRGRRGRRLLDARRIRADTLHPRRQERRRADSAPQRGRCAQRRPGVAQGIRKQLSLHPEQTLDPRLRNRARPRLHPQIRRTRTGHRRPERIQLRRTRHRGLRHLLAAGQTARLQHPRSRDSGPHDDTVRFSPFIYGTNANNGNRAPRIRRSTKSCSSRAATELTANTCR